MDVVAARGGKLGIAHPNTKSPEMILRRLGEQVQRNSCAYMYIVLNPKYIHGVLFLEKCAKCCTSKCNMHSTECLDLTPLTGRGRSMWRKAGDSSPEHQESSHDTEASKRAGSNKKRESYAYMYYCNIDKCTCLVFFLMENA